MKTRWRARVVKGYMDTARVELWRRFSAQTIEVAELSPRLPDFDRRLAEAIATARDKAITLNGGIRHAARRLP